MRSGGLFLFVQFLVMMRSRFRVMMHHMMPVMMNHPAMRSGTAMRLRLRKTCHTDKYYSCQ
jgi:hypothetical protein